MECNRAGSSGVVAFAGVCDGFGVLAFGQGMAAVEKAVARPAPVAYEACRGFCNPGELDLRLMGQALARKRGWIIVPTVLAAVLSVAAVNMVTPRYKSEARILIDGRENVFLRPNGERNEERNALDPEAVTSQVQLLLSRDLAREIIKKNKLAERPEFDPVLQGLSPLKSVLALVGIGRDPFSLTRKSGCWTPITTASPPMRSTNRASL